MSAREQAPLSLRVYGLEGQVASLDAAIERERKRGENLDTAVGQHAVTLAKHEQQLRDDRTRTDERIATLVSSQEKLTGSLTKVYWSLITFAMTIAGMGISAALGLIPVPGT